MVQVRDRLIPLAAPRRAVRHAGRARPDSAEGTVVIIEDNGRRSALVVDELLGKQEVVIKSLGETFGSVRGVAGGAILGDGRIGLILDAQRARRPDEHGAAAQRSVSRERDTQKEMRHGRQRPRSQEPDAATAGAGALAGKYLTFALGREEYGLPVLKVREIIKVMDITAGAAGAAPRARRDQPARQGDPGDRSAPASSASPSQDYTERTCIIVVDVDAVGREGDDGHRRRLGVGGAERHRRARSTRRRSSATT